MTTLWMATAATTHWSDASGGGNLFRIQGVSDLPLSDMGRYKAYELAGKIENLEKQPVALYTSPLKRARQTAEPIAQKTGLRPVVAPDLAAINYGALEGIPFPETFKYPEAQLAVSRGSPPDTTFPGGGENVMDFHRRVKKALDRIKANHRNQVVVVVCHAWVLASAKAAYINGGDYDEWKPPGI